MEALGGGDAGKDGEWRALELRRRAENRRWASAGGVGECDGLGAAACGHAPLSPSNGLGLVVPAPSASLASSSSTSSGVSLPRLAQATREAHGIRMQILDAETRHYATLASCDRQFSTENAVRLLGADIGVVQQKVRQKNTQLEDLHRRVLRLSMSLHDASPDKAFATTKLKLEENIRTQQLDGLSCRSTGLEMIPKHVGNCSGGTTTSLLPTLRPRSNQQSHSTRGTTPPGVDQSSAVTLPSIQSEPILPRFTSQPPRNLRAMKDGISHRSILLGWEPPIFTGSNLIIDYELRFAVRQTSATVADRQISIESLPPVHTSRWCLQVPVAPNQFRLDGLVAAQEYCDFVLYAITINGRSEPSNRVDAIETAPSIGPTRPLFLSIGAVTATTITLSWLEPLDSGGKPLMDYEITFIEAVMEDKDASRFEDGSLDVADVKYRPKRIRTYSASTTFTMTKLLSGKEHKQFRVRAVNDDGKPGEYSESINSIFTIAPGNEFRLLDELQAAVNSRARIVDSQFLSGFMQRYDRQHYIQQVSRFITMTHPQFEDRVNAIVSGDTAEPQVEDDPVIVPEEPTTKLVKKFDDMCDEEKIAERRRQFHFRLVELRDELKRAEYNVQWCNDRRIDLVALIRSAESRILEKQAELERARMFRGPQMDSDVFENGRQRFYTKELVIALEDEIEIDQLYIVDTKSEMVQVENYLRADEKRCDTLKQRLEERMDALAEFERNPIASREENAAAATMVKLQHGSVHRAFLALAKNCVDCKEMREKVKATLLRIKHYHLRASMRKWLAATNMGGGSSSVNELIGIGSRELLGAAMDRDDLLVETQEILKQVRTVDDHLETVKWMKDQARPADDEVTSGHHGNGFVRDGRTVSHLEFEKYASTLLEADARMRLRDFSGALQLYQSAYVNTKWAEMMSAQQVASLLIRTGKATFELQQFEHAASHFRRASLLSTRSSLRKEHAEAELFLGDTQFELRSLRSSVESYERSLLAFDAVGDQQGQLRCCRGLQRTYSILSDKEMEDANRQLADEIEFALTNTIESANKQLDRLQQRIVGVGASSSCEITLERVGAIVPRLRKERITRKLSIREELQFAQSLEKLLAEKKKLLEQGEEDLKRALASDSSEVDSSVINGCVARYEIENFKQKLAKLMGAVRAGEEGIIRAVANVRIRVSNAEDEIHELEQELIVETGALMQRMMGKERLRCFRFNAANEHLKNVVGTASGGFPTCVAASSMTGLLFDLLTGSCLAQALGDPRKEHLGAPTGHQAPIVSLFYTERRIYTGCADATLGVWDVHDELIGGYSISLSKIMYEFDAAVVSVTADTDWFACGCSDCDVFVFDAHTLAIITQIISAHLQTATSLSVVSSRGVLCSGGADHQVKVWKLEASASSASSTRRRAVLVHTLEALESIRPASPQGERRVRGHEHTITCVKQAANEIVSGDAGGRVVVWNLDADDKLLRMCDPHRGDAVTCLQFDATRVVSGSSRGVVCVIDFATGNLLQTLRGHHEAVMDLQFDRKRLVSMSADGKLRLWFWLAAGAGDGKTKKFHILGAGETLRSLSLKYRTSTQKLLQWNGLPDSTHVYLGQKLVVGVMGAEGSAGALEEEMKALDREVSVAFGKLSYEDLEFVAANKAKTTDAEAQWAAQKVAMLAKEYFPPLDEGEEQKPSGGDAKDDKNASESEDDSDASDLDMPVEVEGGENSDADQSDHEESGEDQGE